MPNKRDKGSVRILSDVEVPEKYYSRTRLGVQVLDEIFGGEEWPGLLPGASILFTGFPGAGKSTMALQLADLLQRHSGKSVLYNVGEENFAMTKMRADRLGLRAGFCVSKFTAVEDLIKYCKKNGIEILFQDSLQTLTFGDLYGGRLMKKVGHMLADFATDNDVITFVIGQITKGGSFAGPMIIKHEVDVHAHLNFNRDTGNRIFELQKNRFGPAMMPYEFMLSANGMDFRQMTESETGGKATTAAVRKRTAIDKTKEMLIRGERLSGYSFTDNQELARFVEDELDGKCSGGWWRGILSLAVSELERENHRFGKETINRREHVYMEI